VKQLTLQKMSNDQHHQHGNHSVAPCDGEAKYNHRDITVRGGATAHWMQTSVIIAWY
jgi:hypothetical protein